MNEYAYEAALDAASDRVRVVEIGRTNPILTGTGQPGNRPINLLILGYPSPPATAAAISSRPTISFNCNVHGDEPQGRESCLIFARMLAFTTDPHLLEVLANTTVLIVPAINGNGRARNTRGNETGADLNRDHRRAAASRRRRAFATHASRLHARRSASTCTRATRRTCRSSPRGT